MDIPFDCLVSLLDFGSEDCAGFNILRTVWSIYGVRTVHAYSTYVLIVLQSAPIIQGISKGVISSGWLAVRHDSE